MSEASMIVEVLIAPDNLQELIRNAYLAGCEDVQANYRPESDPEFGEASYDYVASLDFTTTTRPSRNTNASAVAYRVKDFADGWILCHTLKQAEKEAEGCGNAIQALYI